MRSCDTATWIIFTAVAGWSSPHRSSSSVSTETVRPEDVAETIACGPDPERHVEAVKQFVDAGFDHICLNPINPDLEGFHQFWRTELKPRLELL